MSTQLQPFLKMVQTKPYVILDTETTALKNAEICQIGILSSDGKTLLDMLIKPTKSIPPEVSAIHGITNEMVKDAPPWAEIVSQVADLLQDKQLVVYNLEYDLGVLYSATQIAGADYIKWDNIPAQSWCAKEAYAQYKKDWNSYYKSYKWHKLTEAVKQQGLDVKDAHSALGDCVMTWHLCRKMAGITDEN